MIKVSDHALKVSRRGIKMCALPHFPQVFMVTIYTCIDSKSRYSVFLLSPGQLRPFSTVVAGIAF